MKNRDKNMKNEGNRHMPERIDRLRDDAFEGNNGPGALEALLQLINLNDDGHNVGIGEDELYARLDMLEYYDEFRRMSEEKFRGWYDHFFGRDD